MAVTIVQLGTFLKKGITDNLFKPFMNITMYYLIIRKCIFHFSQKEIKHTENH